MAITFLEKRKRLKTLIPILATVLLITVVIIWRGFFVKEKPSLPEKPSIPTREITIDFQVLESPVLEKFQPFEKATPLEEEAGRENPFIPY